MTGAVLALDSGDRRREVRLEAYLDAVAEERAQVEAIAWIKSLRHARVDGVPLRRRFTVRGDSLWWFAELYLHKQQVILALFKIIGALEALLDRERPRSVQLVSGSRLGAWRRARLHGVPLRRPTAAPRASDVHRLCVLPQWKAEARR